MDKYIKESELFKRILNVDFKHDYDGCIKFCQSIPAADVQEVRHGRWEWKEDLKAEDENGWLISEQGYVCSECGFIGSDNFRYCPNCGARMDEVEK